MNTMHSNQAIAERKILLGFDWSGERNDDIRKMLIDEIDWVDDT